MEQQLKDIRDQQKKSWSKFSAGRKKWDVLTMEFMQPMADEIIHLLNPQPKDNILDVAAGTGEPGLTIASMLPRGKVTITDLSEEMLEITKEKVTQRGLTNIDTVACDVSELPFADNTFDDICCRCGFMFFLIANDYKRNVSCFEKYRYSIQYKHQFNPEKYYQKIPI